MGLSLRCLVIAVFVAAPAFAQPKTIVPARPRLGEHADTNSAQAYFEHGKAEFLKDAKEAAAAFYWAARIDPRWADPIYAGLFTSRVDPRLKDLDTRSTRRFLDSMYVLALLRDPFVRVRVDQKLFGVVGSALMAARARDARDHVRRADVYLRGSAYQRAVESFGEAIKRDSNIAGLYVGRAHAFYYLQQYDSASADLGRAIRVVSKKEDESLVVVYQSKALIQYTIAHVRLMANDVESAREAYGRALAEDLSFYMAHVRLANMAALNGDTATALHEFDTAVQLQGHDAIVRYDYGYMLLKMGKYDEAAEQLRKAIELEPYFAPPYLSLGAIEQASGNDARARELFEQFVARAGRYDPKREAMRKILGASATARP